MRIQSAAAITQGTGNGDGLGRGSQSQWVSGDIAPVFLFSGCEITYLTEIATNGPKRGMLSVRAQELKNSRTSFMNGIEALFQGDSSGQLDFIPATATVSSGSGTGATTSFISGMNNANQFQDQQVVDVFESEGGNCRGSATVSYVDGGTNTLWFSTDLPDNGGATAVGDILTIHNAANVAGSNGAALGSSLAGIQTYQVNSNTGSYLGLNRASYPSRLSTPVINLGGKSVNPIVPYRADILVKRGLGQDSKDAKDLIWYGGEDQQLAVTQLYQQILLQQSIYEGGNKAGDVVKREMTPTFGGREFVVSYNATPGRIDGLCLGNWGIVEMVEPSLYSFGNGVTSMPVPDPDGSYLTSNVFFYNAALNLFNSNAKAGVVIEDAGEPLI